MKKRAKVKETVAPTVELDAHDFTHHQKNHLWYIGVGILLTGFLILTVSAKDYLLSAVVLAAAVALFRLANLRPEKKRVAISDKGIQWGNSFYGFHSFRAFWIGVHEDSYSVYLERLNFQPTISFIVTEGNLEAVLDVLADNLPFHPHRDTPLPDRLSRLLRL